MSMNKTGGTHLSMNSSLREDSHLELLKRTINRRGSILSNEVRTQTSFDDNVYLRTPRVDMRCVEATWSEKAYSHCHTSADQCWKDFTICFDCEAAFAAGDCICVWRWVLEVIDPVFGLEESDAVYCCWRKLELLDQSQAG